jgi:peptidoglycan-associated lipoprotein
MTGRAGMRMSVVLVIVGLLIAAAGCASKQVASTSGDQSTTMKGKGAGGAAGSVENVKQEPMVFMDPPSVGGSATAPSTPGSRSLPSGSTAVLEGSGMAAAADSAAPTDIYFDFDQYTIRSDARSVLESHAQWMRDQPGKSLVIEGHCDERGTLAYNLVLGEKRARSTKQYLEDLGIPGSRIHTTSYGEVRPFCKDHNEGCWSKNRRAHFLVQ